MPEATGESYYKRHRLLKQAFAISARIQADFAPDSDVWWFFQLSKRGIRLGSVRRANWR